MEPFVIDVPESQRADLDRRLAATRFPPDSRITGWSHGMPTATLRDLVGYWRTQFDWRTEQERLNRYQQFTTVIDGARIHFVRSRAAQPGRRLYWFTGSIGTSLRPYCDRGDAGPHPLIEVPASVIVQAHEGEYPGSLARKSYLDLRSFDKLERGGHFTAVEAPGDIARTILALERLVR